MALDIVSHMTQTANPVTPLASPLGDARGPRSGEGVDGGKNDYDTLILCLILCLIAP